MKNTVIGLIKVLNRISVCNWEVVSDGINYTVYMDSYIAYSDVTSDALENINEETCIKELEAIIDSME